MNPQSRWPVGLVIAVLLAAALACSVQVSTAHVKEARLTKDAAGQTPAKVYAPGDTWTCVVTLAEAPGDTVTKAIWRAVEVEGLEPDTVLGESQVTGGSGALFFTLAPDEPRLPGSYRVDLYVNDRRQESVAFKVK